MKRLQKIIPTSERSDSLIQIIIKACDYLGSIKNGSVNRVVNFYHSVSGYYSLLLICNVTERLLLIR